MVVDIENEFCKPGGKFYLPERAHVYQAMITAVKGLAQQARETRVPIVYIQSVRTLREAEFTVFGAQPHLQIGTWNSEIVEELGPRPEDIVVQKFCHDAFFRPDLDRVLGKLVKEPTKCHAIVTGGGTSVCYHHAVMGFHLRDYRTVVPVDCLYSGTDGYHQLGLEMLSHPAYPNVVFSRSDLIKMSPP